MGELWRDTVDLLKRRPLLWVPVLLVDLLGFLVNVGLNAAVRAMVLGGMQHHTALGGSVRGPLDASTAQHLEIAAVVLTWISYLVRLLLYASALIVTSALARAFAQRERQPWLGVGPALRRRAGGVVELALRALAVFAVGAFLVGTLSRFLVAHQQAATTQAWWYGSAAGLLLFLVLIVLLTGPALRVLSGAEPDPAQTRLGQLFAMGPVLVSLLLGAFVGANSRTLRGISPGARFPLELTGSLLAALPYVLLFVGLGVLAMRMAQTSELEPPDETDVTAE